MVLINYYVGGSMKKKQGFTLIELLAVIFIIGIISVIAIPTINSLLKQAREII